MSKNQLVILGVIVVLLLGAGGGWYLTRSTPDASLAAGATAGNLPPDKIGPKEHTMGNVNAPVVLIEYFAQGCSVCARFDQDVFPLLKAKYIDTGKVRYVMRLFPLFPATDPPSYKLDLCVPPENFFAAADLLFRNQPQWDAAEYPVADQHAGLIRMARIMGLTPEQADACMNSTAHDAEINNMTKEAVARYNPNGTPTFVIDFKNSGLSPLDWGAMQAALDAALAAKGVK